MKVRHVQKHFNNLADLRFVFALFVVISHTVQLADIDGLFVLRVIFSSDTAVQAFFILSGFLTVNSFERSGREIDKFYVRRFLRIMPAYTAAVLFFCALGLTQALSFGRDVSLYDIGQYLVANLSLLNFLHPGIDGVFAGNPYTEINGALWTIKVEVGFYILVPLICLLGNRLSFFAVAALLILIGVLWMPGLQWAAEIGLPTHPSLSHQLPGQLAYFGLGVLLFWVSQAPERSRLAAATVAVGALISLALGEPRAAVQIALLSLVIYWVIQLPQLVPGKRADLSYGIYLCHFPIIQLLVNWRGWYGLEEYLLLLIVPALAFAYAMASWRLVEEPAMNLGKRMAAHEARHRSA